MSFIKQKYKLWVISGIFGGGKTLFMSGYAVDNWKNYDVVYSTYKLYAEYVPNVEWIKPRNFRAVKLKNLEPNSLLLATESSNFIDRRESMKKKNIKITQALMEIRKTRVHQIYDIFDIQYLDFRLVEFTTLSLKALGEIDTTKINLENIENKTFLNKIMEGGYFFYQKQEYNPKKQRFTLTGEPFIEDMKKYYNAYDTFEITDNDKLLENWFEKDSKQNKNKCKRGVTLN